MALTSGNYYITSKMESASAVGRNPIEDKSANPKKVILLPRGVLPQNWVLTRLPDGNFNMSIRGGNATDIDSLLFAVLLEEPVPTIWKIEPRFHQGENTYTIISTNTPDGWVVPTDNEGTQIILRRVIAGLSQPPSFPSNELFVITEAPLDI